MPLGGHTGGGGGARGLGEEYQALSQREELLLVLQVKLHTCAQWDRQDKSSESEREVEELCFGKWFSCKNGHWERIRLGLETSRGAKVREERDGSTVRETIIAQNRGVVGVEAHPTGRILTSELLRIRWPIKLSDLTHSEKFIWKQSLSATKSVNLECLSHWLRERTEAQGWASEDRPGVDYRPPAQGQEHSQVNGHCGKDRSLCPKRKQEVGPLRPDFCPRRQFLKEKSNTGCRPSVSVGKCECEEKSNDFPHISNCAARNRWTIMISIYWDFFFFFLVIL